MTLPTFQRHYSSGDSVTSSDSERIQQNIEEAFQPITANPLLDGILHEDLSLTGGSDYILSHELRRAYRGWWVVKPSTTTDKVYESSTTNTDNTKFLYLTCTNDQTVSIWVW